MIPELGHFALILALGLGLIQAAVPVFGARTHDPECSWRWRQPPQSDSSPSVAISVPGAGDLLRAVRISPVQTVSSRILHSAMPLVYKITSAWGNHEGSMLLWVLILSLFGALVAIFGSNLPDLAQGERARRAVVDRGRVLSFHSADIQPVPADRRCSARGTRSQSAAAGSRSRHPPAASLSRLCRLLDHLLLCDCGAYRGTDRCGLGALGAALGAAGLDVPDARHRDGLVLGLLYAGLGRLVVLGSGRERLADAVARRDGAVALGAGDGEAQRPQGVDDPARDPGVLALPGRHVPGPLRRVSPRCMHSPATRCAACSS